MKLFSEIIRGNDSFVQIWSSAVHTTVRKDAVPFTYSTDPRRDSVRSHRRWFTLPTSTTNFQPSAIRCRPERTSTETATQVRARCDVTMTHVSIAKLHCNRFIQKYEAIGFSLSDRFEATACSRDQLDAFVVFESTEFKNSNRTVAAQRWDRNPKRMYIVHTLLTSLAAALAHWDVVQTSFSLYINIQKPIFSPAWCSLWNSLFRCIILKNNAYFCQRWAAFVNVNSSWQ